MEDLDPARPLCVYYLCYIFISLGHPTGDTGTLGGTTSPESPTPQGQGWDHPAVVGKSSLRDAGVKGGHER